MTDIPEVSRGDELGGLARAIDRMGVSLKMAVTQLEPAPVEPAARSTPPPRHSMAVPKTTNGAVKKTASSA